MTTNTNTNDDLGVSCAHALGASSLCWLVVGVQSSSMVLCYSCCRLRHLPSLQRAALRKLLQRGVMHAYMLCVCTVYFHPWHMSGRPPPVGGIEIFVVRVRCNLIHYYTSPIISDSFPTIFN